MIRAFLAVQPTGDVAERLSLVQQELQQRLGGMLANAARISWVKPPSIHLTIKFLGNIEVQQVDPLRAAIEQVAESHLGMNIPFGRFGVFPRPQQPRVLWVGPPEEWKRSKEAERFEALHRAVDERCRAFGFMPEKRPFEAHLTLARIKEGEWEVGRALRESGILERPVAVGRLQIDTIVLMKSELRPSGPVYTTLWMVGRA